MEIRNHQLYRHNSHKLKNSVTNLQLSKRFSEKPLKRESSDISFKGFPQFVQNLLYKQHDYDLGHNLSLLKKALGDAPINLKNNTKNWSEISKQLQISSNGEHIHILEKNWPKLLGEAILYPVTELPFHILHSLKKSFFNGKGAQAASKSNSGITKFINKKFTTLNNSDIVNSFIGYMDTAKKNQYNTAKVRNANIFTNSLKMFGRNAGNYNGVHERALTRIVTGFIPAFFLANDAYNLSRICDDDPQKADKERKLRFNQETKRVLSNAYLQLITLGALSKWINKSKAIFVGVTAVTVVITEALSRLSNGKKIHWINKEEAIEMNKKEGVLPTDYKDEDKISSEKPVNNGKPGFKGSKVFSDFGVVNDLKFNNNVAQTGKDTSQPTKETKPLLSLATVGKWFVATIALGFALKHLKSLKINQNVKVGDYLKVISTKYTNLIKKFTQKEYNMPKQEYEKVIKKLKDYDPVFGKRIDDVVKKKLRANNISKKALDLAKLFKDKGLNEHAEAFTHIANSKNASKFSDIEVFNKASHFIKSRNNDIITKNLNEFFDILQQKGFSDEITSLKNIIFKDGTLNTNNYEKALKTIKNSEKLKDYADAFSSRFMVDSDFELIKMFADAMKALRKTDKEKAKELALSVLKVSDNEVVNLGKVNKTITKGIADIIQEPFKFAWGTITLPYKHIAKPISQMINPQTKLPEWPKEFESVQTAISRLTRKPMVKLPAIFGPHTGKAKIDYNKKEFAKYMNTQINKAFNTATMSSMSNSDLSVLAKNTSTAATIWFLTTDNHNMVMQKSNGKDKDQAVLKAKERVVQEGSRQLYNVMFINLFNNTMKNLYNSSLFGAQTVNTISTLIGEYVNRKAIGMSVKPLSRDEILDKEYKNLNDPGIKGKLFRFMSRLTGKKALTQRETTNKK